MQQRSVIFWRVSAGREGDRGQILPLFHLSRPSSEKSCTLQYVTSQSQCRLTGQVEHLVGRRGSMAWDRAGFVLWSFLWLSLKFCFCGSSIIRNIRTKEVDHSIYLKGPTTCERNITRAIIYTVYQHGFLLFCFYLFLPCPYHLQYIRCLVFTCLKAK